METKAEVWIPLTQGKVAVIDFEDFEKVRGIKWCATKKGKTFYACRQFRILGKSHRIYLHQELMQPPPPGMEIDHIDRDGLNNRRSSNLRIVTHQQNQLNRGLFRTNKASKFRGVSRNKRDQNWRAGITVFGKAFYLGYFDNEIEAAKAYDAAARKYFGEYAALNFPAQKENQCSTNAGVAL